MRATRTRRRFRIGLIAFLAVSATLFIEARIEAFAPQVKGMVELKAEEALGGAVRLSIGNVAGGVVNPISFNEITLRGAAEAPAAFPSVVIDSIRTNCRVWDILFRRGAPARGFLSPDSRVYITFTAKDRRASGFVRVEGEPDDAGVKGFIKIPGGEKIDFDGRITRGRFNLEFKGRAGALFVYGKMSAPGGDIVMRIRGDRLKLYGLTVSCDAVVRHTATASADDPAGRTFAGEVETRRLAVSGKTLPALKARYRVGNGVLDLERLDAAGIGTVSGSVRLAEPYEARLKFLAVNVSIARILALAGADEASGAFAGTVDAAIELIGPLRNPRSTADIRVRQGRIATMGFDSLTGILKGDGPVLRIEEARIVRESGSLILAGEIDVRALGTGRAFDRVELKSDDKALTWDSFVTAAAQGVEEVQMKKRLLGDVDVGFKKYINGEKIDESSRYRDQVRLEYKLHGGDSLAMSVQDGSGFVGLQHRDKF